jgi:hypothetical protein
MSRAEFLIDATLFGVSAILLPVAAFAYVDPNAAGLLYQIFFPLVVAATIAWRRIKDLMSWVWFRIKQTWD